MEWTKKEIEFLKKNYPNKGRLWCMKKLHRTNGSVRQQTSNLQLKQNLNSEFFKDWQNRARLSKIGKKRPIHSKIMKDKGKKGLLPQQNRIWTDRDHQKSSERTKKWIRENGHPKGMLGKKHSAKVVKMLGKNFKKMWADKNSKVNSKEYRQYLSDRQSKLMALRIQTGGSIYSRSNNGWYKINRKKYYFRSGWEVVYAQYLEWLRSKKEIKKWQYEPDVFWFEKIRRGVRSYCPDFKIFNNDKTFEYHEVKGYMDSKSKTKIKRMAKYFPETKLIVIAKDEYFAVKKFERLFPKATILKKK